MENENKSNKQKIDAAAVTVVKKRRMEGKNPKREQQKKIRRRIRKHWRRTEGKSKNERNTGRTSLQN